MVSSLTTTVQTGIVLRTIDCGGVVQVISHKHCSVLHRADGYSYLSKTGAPLGFEKPSIRAQEIS
jgi:hypothetical protein